MDRYTHVHVCGGSEPECTDGRKNFILGHRLEKGGTTCFQFFSREEQKIFKAAWEGGQMFFQNMFPISGAP